MILFLSLLIVAIVLGILGVALKGLFYLLIIGIVLVIIDLIFLGAWMNRTRRQPTR